MISPEPESDDWLAAVDKHLECAENAIQTNNLGVAEAELLAARTKLWQHQGRNDIQI